MTARKLCPLIIFFFLAAGLLSQAVGDVSKGKFVVPEDDLPSIVVAGCRVAFTRNGAFAVAKDGAWLFDGGLSYAMPGWNEWGTQIRRSAAEDWRDHSEGVLVLGGTLFDFNGKKRFTFLQRVCPIPDGLRFAYEVTPLEKRKPEVFGFTLHFPVARASSGSIAFWPGFGTEALPASYGKAVLCTGNARGAEVHVADRAQITVVAERRISWRLLDERKWQLNTFRLEAWDEGFTAPLSRGETISFSFDLVLNGTTPATLPFGPALCDLDEHGRLAVWAAHDKVLEGGLYHDACPSGWFFESAQMTVSAITSSEKEVLQSAGRILVAGTATDYEVRAAVDSKSLTLIFRALPAGGAVFTTVPKVRFAFPCKTLVAWSKRDSIPGESGSDQKALQQMVGFVLQNGIQVQLFAKSAWTFSKERLGAEECYLLTIPTSGVGDDSAEARVQVRVEAVEEVRQKGL